MDKIINVSQYGAKGDGVTDDGPSISKAVNDALSGGCALCFEAGKTYRIESTENSLFPFTSPFSIGKCRGLTIDGHGARLIYNPRINYFVICDSEDITIRNFVFDYTVTPYLCGVVTEIDGQTVRFSTDVEPYADECDYSGMVAFSIKYNPGKQRRPHRFISFMKKTGEKQVDVTYINSLGVSCGDLVFLPNPGVGHCFGETVYMGGNRGTLRFENIEINAASTFIAAIKGNDAEMFFDRVDFIPPAGVDRTLKMVAWRDGFHCKDNRRPMHWDNCRCGVLFDDVFNLSGTLGVVNGKGPDGSLDMLNYEYLRMGRHIPFSANPGDVLDFYDIRDGKFYGTSEIENVIYNENGTTSVRLSDRTLSDAVPDGCVAGNRSSCAPGSTVKNCSFEGTFRFLRDVSIENTDFNLLEIWMMVEGSVEGPLPGNIGFSGCTFRGGNIEIDAFNRETNTYMPEIAGHIKNIRAVDCRFEEDWKFVCNTKKCELGTNR